MVKVNSKGRITAKKSGTATISGTVKQNKKQAVKKYICKVRVSAAKKKGKKVLVAYFSQTGTTKAVTEKIHKLTGGDILRIREKDKYPNDYDKTVARAKRERNQNARPKTTSVVANIKDYDIIYIGYYPIWWHIAPMIIGTFLENYDLSGMDIYPFTQSASMDMEQFENSMNFIRDNAPGAAVHDGLFVRATDTTGIYNYLAGNGLVTALME